jgi:uncharacterized RDD family membrane protein YckC
MEAALHCLNHFDAIEGLQYCARCGRVFCGDCVVRLRGLPYCGSCKAEQVLDVRSGVVAVGLLHASIGRRFVAQIVDGLAIGLPSAVVAFGVQTAIIFSKIPGAAFIAMGASLLIRLTAFTVYEGLMLQYRAQTVGKMAMQMRVVGADGSPISRRQAWTRATVRSLLAILSIIDYIPAFFTTERVTLHDMAAGTRVVSL